MGLKHSTIFRILAIAALITLIVVLQLTLDVFSYFFPEKIQDWLEKAGFAAPLVHMLTMALAIVVTPIPSLPLDIAAGAFFGPFLGTLYSALGALVAAVFVALFFIIPWLIERYDFLKLKRYFGHEQEKTFVGFS